jgi:integrase
VAWIIQRYIEEMPDINPDKPIGASHLYALRRLQKDTIAAKQATELKKGDIIDFCKRRRADGAQPATINQDITFLRGPLKFAGSAWDECEDVSDAAIAAAMPLLKKYQLIGKSRPRDRRPTQDEIDALLAYFEKQEKHPNSLLPMRDIVEFSLLSARRISETCRLRWGDVNGADMTCIVRDMKDPKQKKGNDHEFPLLGKAWDIVMRQPRVDPTNPEERIFPYNSKSCSAAYTRAKNALGIKNLRLHDNRREAASRFIEGHESFGGEQHSIPQAMVLTGHKNPTILIRTYTRLKAKDLHPKRTEEKAA